MLSIIEKNYDEATRVGFETLIVASVIASAIIISTTFGKLIKPKFKFNRSNQKNSHI
jgi:Na+/H+-dicarboxylate symporter